MQFTHLSFKIFKATKTHICRKNFCAPYCQPSDISLCHRCRVVSYKADFFHHITYFRLNKISTVLQ